MSFYYFSYKALLLALHGDLCFQSALYPHAAGSFQLRNWQLLTIAAASQAEKENWQGARARGQRKLEKSTATKSQKVLNAGGLHAPLHALGNAQKVNSCLEITLGMGCYCGYRKGCHNKFSTQNKAGQPLLERAGNCWCRYGEQGDVVS